MKQVIPYSSMQDALSSLDNGGRFYNIFTKAGDGKVDPAELSKVAGIIGDRQRMFLFYELALSNLEQSAVDEVQSALSPELNQQYQLNRPKNYKPSDVQRQGSAGEAVIISGYPKVIDAKDKLAGFIMVPIMAGKVMTFTMIPIIEKFHVYELYDEPSGATFIIAHAKSDAPLPTSYFTFAGVLKELKQDKTGAKSEELFLEAFYYVEGEQ